MLLSTVAVAGIIAPLELVEVEATERFRFQSEVQISSQILNSQRLRSRFLSCGLGVEGQNGQKKRSNANPLAK